MVEYDALPRTCYDASRQKPRLNKNDLRPPGVMKF